MRIHRIIVMMIATAAMMSSRGGGKPLKPDSVCVGCGGDRSCHARGHKNGNCHACGGSNVCPTCHGKGKA